MQKHIVICWELGEGYGHILGLRPLIKYLLAQGASVTVLANLAVKCHTALQDLNVKVLPSPRNNPIQATRLAHYANYADLLFDWAYRDEQSLNGLMHQWLGMFELLKPDKILCDHSPTAVLAARISDIPCATYGTGYYVPPKEYPLAPFTNVSDAQKKQMHERENEVLDNIDKIVKQYSCKFTISQVAGVFEQAQQFLFTLKELDHYNRASEENYYGPRFDLEYGDVPDWSHLSTKRHQAKKIFVYLKQNTPKFSQIVQQLINTQHLIVLHTPDADKKLEEALVPFKHIHFAKTAVNITEVLNQVDLVICNGGHGLSAAVLLAAKHALLLPTHIEQMILTKKLTTLNLATGVNVTSQELQIGQQIEALLQTRPFQKNLDSFAAKYSSVVLSEQITELGKWCVS